MRLEFHKQVASDISRIMDYSRMSQGESLRTNSMTNCDPIFRGQPTVLSLTAFESVISDA
jgi:hypothetical protein